MVEVRLVLLLGVDISILRTEGGLPPDIERLEPRAGGGDGSDTVEGEDNGTFCVECPLIEPSRREGGAGGALPLFDRGLIFSGNGGVNELEVEDSSSGLGDNLAVAAFSLESGILWLWRRLNGGGGAFL